jgi:hypothetical protein
MTWMNENPGRAPSFRLDVTPEPVFMLIGADLANLAAWADTSKQPSDHNAAPEACLVKRVDGKKIAPHQV